MALSKYEERVLTELEAQFQPDEAPPRPRQNCGTLVLSLACLLGGVSLLVAARHAGLLIRISDLWGFATTSVASGLSLAGHALLLGSAFFLGHACCDRARPRGETATRSVARRERV